MNTDHFKHKLEEELSRVTRELESVGTPVNAKIGDWEAKAPEMDVMSPLADSNEAADKLEEYTNNRSINDSLEVRHNEIKAALERIAEGTFGTCSVCGAKIEDERLEANPAAATCIAHTA